jgi:hypothetical protein
MQQKLQYNFHFVKNLSKKYFLPFVEDPDFVEGTGEDEVGGVRAHGA